MGHELPNERYHSTPEAQELEREVEFLDSEIVRLVNRRRIVADHLAALRQEKGEPVYPHSEELQQLERWRGTYIGGAVISLLQKMSRRRTF